jgi:hypothetical protein
MVEITVNGVKTNTYNVYYWHNHDYSVRPAHIIPQLPKFQIKVFLDEKKIIDIFQGFAKFSIHDPNFCAAALNFRKASWNLVQWVLDWCEDTDAPKDYKYCFYDITKVEVFEDYVLVEGLYSAKQE